MLPELMVRRILRLSKPSNSGSQFLFGAAIFRLVSFLAASLSLSSFSFSKENSSLVSRNLSYASWSKNIAYTSTSRAPWKASGFLPSRSVVHNKALPPKAHLGEPSKKPLVVTFLRCPLPSAFIKATSEEPQRPSAELNASHLPSGDQV